jgi:pimeloyl-ACP methyl ester carboxylesterase
VTLVGHSFGGGIAMQFCYLFPQRVERLVLVASGGLGREVSPLLRSATLPGAEWVLPLIASSLGQWPGRDCGPHPRPNGLAAEPGCEPGLARVHLPGRR